MRKYSRYGRQLAARDRREAILGYMPVIGMSPLGLPPDGFEGGPFFTDSLEERLSELAPEIHERVAWLLNRLAVRGSLYAYRAPLHAAAVVVNQAINDGQDLLLDLTRLRGRPATRAARALVEHVVNFRNIIRDPVAADRYVSHGAVAAQLEAEARVGLTRLQGGEHRAERHRLRKLARDSAAEAREALKRFGGIYRRSWSPESLFERAGSVGLTHLYDYYRLSSMVLHGAVAGAAGTVSREHRQPVHRTGPSLQPCVSAYHEGLRSLAVLRGDLSATAGLPDMTPLTEAIEAVADYWRSTAGRFLPSTDTSGRVRPRQARRPSCASSGAESSAGTGTSRALESWSRLTPRRELLARSRSRTYL